MADNLFPQGYESDVVTIEAIQENNVTGYRPSVAFDWETGDFPRDGKYQLIDCNGVDGWRSWCVTCVSTERYAYLAHGSDFGISTQAAMRAESREEAESILTREITEALLADPYERTAYIEDITYNWTAPDAVEATITVRGIEEVTIDFTVSINMAA